MSDPHEPQHVREGWNEAKPEVIPRGTPWPAFLAVGITCLGWGLVASPIIVGIGGVLFVVSLAGWIGEIRHEH